jgi:hypothetical protein
MTETENQIRLRRAKEALAAARDREAIARRALADATESVKSAKERYEELFMAEERAAADRLKADYRHATS